MLDMTDTIEAKSDQMNFVDLVAPKTVTITGVKKVAGDQPVHIICDDDAEKPWKPCKNMRRVMVQIWGKDGEKYIGQKLTLFNDPSVRWAGKELGGIRISQATGIDKPFKVMLPISKGKFAPFAVEPMIVKPKTKLTDEVFDGFCADMEKATTMPELAEVAKQIKDGDFDKDGSAKLRQAYQDAVKVVREA